jgi:hypothetical protein
VKKKPNNVKVGPDGSGYIEPLNIVSAGEMTGLVPTPIITPAEAQAYTVIGGVPISRPKSELLEMLEMSEHSAQ